MSQIPPIPPGTAGADLISTINDRIRRINLLQFGSTSTTNTTVIKAGGGVAAAGDVNYGTHAQRLGAPVADFADGAVWYETDRTVWYQVQIGGWRWIDGVYVCAQASLPTDLGTGDAGFLVSVSDYNHVLRWSGSAWTAGPAWDPPGYIRGFMVDPSPTTGWKLCDGLGDDGSAIGVAHPVKYLKSDGTLGSITSATVAPCLPDLVGTPSFLQFGSTAAGTAAAAAPTLTMNSYTPAGTNSAPTLTMNSYTPTGTNSAPTFTGSAMGTHQHVLPFLESGGNFLIANSPFGTGGSQNWSNIASSPASAGGPTGMALDQATSAGTPSGTVSAPTFTGNAATLTGSVAAPTFTGSAATLTGSVSAPTFTGTPATLTGTISSTGTPPRVTLRPWLRK